MGNSKILHLTLKKKWFDMILSGEKKEEYRAIKKYWQRRFCSTIDYTYTQFKEFDIIRFTNGYGKDKPTFDIELKEIVVDFGIEEWGGEYNEYYYVLKLGEVVK